jgi:putative two-component system response regulator
MSYDQAIAIIVESRGSHFDPDVVDAFCEITDDFRNITDRYAD